jgi:hypothetical protein
MLSSSYLRLILGYSVAKKFEISQCRYDTEKILADASDQWHQYISIPTLESNC